MRPPHQGGAKAALAGGVAVATFALFALLPQCEKSASAFSDQEAFEARVLAVGGVKQAARPTAPKEWATELTARTSAPARRNASPVRADDAKILDAPFLYLSGDKPLDPFTSNEVAGMRKFFALGGLIVIDDASGDGGERKFLNSAREQLGRAIPDTPTIDLPQDHVLFRTFYLLKKVEGRVATSRPVEAIVKRGNVLALFLPVDLGGALARDASGSPEFAVSPGGEGQRERAVRFAVNIAMYNLCSNYKDDQVHAPFLMRRRAGGPRSDP